MTGPASGSDALEIPAAATAAPVPIQTPHVTAPQPDEPADAEPTSPSVIRRVRQQRRTRLGPPIAEFSDVADVADATTPEPSAPATQIERTPADTNTETETPITESVPESSAAPVADIANITSVAPAASVTDAPGTPEPGAADARDTAAPAHFFDVVTPSQDPFEISAPATTQTPKSAMPALPTIAPLVSQRPMALRQQPIAVAARTEIQTSDTPDTPEMSSSEQGNPPALTPALDSYLPPSGHLPTPSIPSALPLRPPFALPRPPAAPPFLSKSPAVAPPQTPQSLVAAPAIPEPEVPGWPTPPIPAMGHAPAPDQSAPEQGGGQPPAPPQDPFALDRLAAELYGRLRGRLVDELYVGRERSQLLTDLT